MSEAQQKEANKAVAALASQAQLTLKTQRDYRRDLLNVLTSCKSDRLVDLVPKRVLACKWVKTKAPSTQHKLWRMMGSLHKASGNQAIADAYRQKR